MSGIFFENAEYDNIFTKSKQNYRKKYIKTYEKLDVIWKYATIRGEELLGRICYDEKTSYYRKRFKRVRQEEKRIVNIRPVRRVAVEIQFRRNV